LQSGARKQSPEVSLVVENNNLEVGDEDRVYKPSVGDEVEGNGNSDGRWNEVRACIRWEIPRSEDQKMYSHSNTTGLYSPKDCKE